MGKPSRTTTRRARNAGNGIAKPNGAIHDGSETPGDNHRAAAGTVIDPAAIPGDGDEQRASDSGGPDGGPKRKRGRPPGSTSGKKTNAIDLGSFGDLLFSAHAMLATITGNSYVAIEQGEAEKLAKAMANVARHYDVPGLSQETLDWIGLIQTAGAIYGSRVMASRLERAAQKRDNPPKPIVQPIRPSPSAPQTQAVPAEIPGLGNVEVTDIPSAFKQ